MGFFSATDGTQIFYQDWGSGDPVVFTHSWLLDSNAWEYQFMPWWELACAVSGLTGEGTAAPMYRAADTTTTRWPTTWRACCRPWICAGLRWSATRWAAARSSGT